LIISRATEGLKEIMEIFSRPSPKKEIRKFVKEYLSAINDRNPFVEDFLDDFF
jgi:hypothetical protein